MTHTNVRYREDAFEARCALCRTWCPITLEFWQPKNGMARCKACWRGYFRLHEAGRTAVEAVAILKRESNRMRYWANRDRYLALSRAWKARNRERVAAYGRMWRARNAAKLAADGEAYYAEARDVILAKKRRAYQERAGGLPSGAGLVP